MESIARELGVSVATVSRALNGKPGISDQLRARVEEELKLRSYHKRRSREKSPAKAAPKSGSSRLHTVAFVVSDDLFEKIMLGNEYYGRHLIAVQKAISEAGLYPLLIGYNQDLNADGMLRCVAERRAQAIIGESWSPALTERIASEVPVVLFNRIATRGNVDTVSTDFHVALESQMQHLYDLGHRRIAHFRVTPPNHCWENTCFWQQYFTFHLERELPLDWEWMAPISFGVDGHREAARAFADTILSAKRRPTAVVTYDLYAEALLAELSARGVKVPEEISLVGFSNLKGSAELPVPLTTYEQDFDLLAREALRLVIDRFERPDAPPRLVRLNGKMVVRQSTGRAP